MIIIVSSMEVGTLFRRKDMKRERYIQAKITSPPKKKKQNIQESSRNALSLICKILKQNERAGMSDSV